MSGRRKRWIFQLLVHPKWLQQFGQRSGAKQSVQVSYVSGRNQGKKWCSWIPNQVGSTGNLFLYVPWGMECSSSPTLRSELKADLLLCSCKVEPFKKWLSWGCSYYLKACRLSEKFQIINNYSNPDYQCRTRTSWDTNTVFQFLMHTRKSCSTAKYDSVCGPGDPSWCQ